MSMRSQIRRRSGRRRPCDERDRRHERRRAEDDQCDLPNDLLDLAARRRSTGALSAGAWSGRLHRQAVPGYAMIRQERRVDFKPGVNRLDFQDVAAYIDPTTVTFKSFTSPEGTRVIEQSFQFDLVSTEKLMERYIDQVITVDQLDGQSHRADRGRLLSTQGGLVLSSGDGADPLDSQLRKRALPEVARRAHDAADARLGHRGRAPGIEKTRITYQTAGITWWADYNLVFKEGDDSNNGFLDIGAWVSILNRSGAELSRGATQAHRRRRQPRTAVPQQIRRRTLEAAAQAT